MRKVVLSASVCTAAGKALVSRQFVEMNRLRVEGLLAAFPKLVGHSKQHTFVETDTVRYVYQPLENQMYLLLITTKASNIVEDLGTLRLLAKVVPDVAGSLQETAINDSAFELIFAFDEVLTAGGYKEEVNLMSIRTNLEMESHEEKMHQAIMTSKMEVARGEMAKKAHELQKQKMDAMRNQFMNGPQAGGMPPPPGRMEGFGGGGGGPTGGFEGFGSNSMGQYDSYNPTSQSQPEPEPPSVIAKGMTLGGKKKSSALVDLVAKEDGLSLLGPKKGGDALGLGAFAPTTAAAAVPSTPLSIALEEKITVSMNREGAVENCEVKGSLTLTANTDVGSLATVAVNKAALSKVSNWNFATHPKVNKPAYERDGVLSLKGGKGIPLSRPVGVLRWSYGAEDAVPLTINCWPEDEGSGSINVNIEFELNRSDVVLNDVNIVFSLGSTDPPAIESIDGQFKHDARAGMMCWHHDTIDSGNSSGSLEFSIGGSNVDVFFPVQVSFASTSLLCPIEVTGVTSSKDGSSIPNALTKSFVPDSYQVA